MSKPLSLNSNLVTKSQINNPNVSIGIGSIQTNKQPYSISIGYQAGLATQGTNSIAIGRNSGVTNQHQNSIILNSSDSILNSITQNSFYVSPIRKVEVNDSPLTYNNITKQINTISSVNKDSQILTSVNNQVMYSYSGYNYRGSNFFPSNMVDTTIVKVSEGSLVPSGGFKWFGGVLAQNGKIYGIPLTSTNICLIDPITNTVDTTTLKVLPGSSITGGWMGGVLAPNGKIYGIPNGVSSVCLIDPITNTVDTTTVRISSGSFISSGGSNWVGGVLAPNGKIYGIPYNSSNVCLIDPVSNTIDTTTVTITSGSSIPFGGLNWQGGVLAPNGKIYGIPRVSSNVCLIDPITNTVDTTTVKISSGSSIPPSNFKWRGGVLAQNGKIYGIPENSTSVLYIDPITNTVDITTVNVVSGSSLSGNAKWVGGVLAPNGKIYGIPSSASNFCLIDPITNTVDTTTVTISSGSNLGGTHEGGVLAPNGNVYGMPTSSSNVLVIKTGIPTLPPWMLAPEFNKF
jgi:hypothetical protein